LNQGWALGEPENEKNVLEPASLVNGLNKSNALLALIDKPLGITTEIYTHVAIRKVKTSARENAPRA